MQTIVTLAVDHHKPISELWTLIAGRAYTIDGVSNVTPVLDPKAYLRKNIDTYQAKLEPRDFAALNCLLMAL